MILKTGNRGFTLMEVMTATCVLSLGTVLIYESFFIALDSFNYCSDYLNVASWMDEKLWDAQDTLSRQGLSSQIETKGGVANRNKIFRWNLLYNLIGENLYQIDLTLSWKEGTREVKLVRSTYAMYEEKKEH
ncbi:MAG: prepilin-type N-terminal cleavage/methylation domain-containing protein [Candidatus Omnitrophica bacterium]|nr:prepilin-type N-terminal cleavage/methylation domain-containing protein [Candidatus Omnitrophota bacterium]